MRGRCPPDGSAAAGLDWSGANRFPYPVEMGRTSVTCVVAHPKQWAESGYRAVQYPPKRCRIIDVPGLMKLLGLAKLEQLQQARAQWVDGVLERRLQRRDGRWTESLAVGSEQFVAGIKRALGMSVPSVLLWSPRSRHRPSKARQILSGLAMLHSAQVLARAGTTGRVQPCTLAKGGTSGSCPLSVRQQSSWQTGFRWPTRLFGP